MGKKTKPKIEEEQTEVGTQHEVSVPSSDLQMIRIPEREDIQLPEETPDIEESEESPKGESALGALIVIAMNGYFKVKKKEVLDDAEKADIKQKALAVSAKYPTINVPFGEEIELGESILNPILKRAD